MNKHNRLFAVLGLCLSFTACEDPEAAQADAAVEGHIDVIRDRIAANNAKDWDTWESLHTPDAVRTAPDVEGELVSAAAMRADIEELVVTFPDYHLELVEAFGQGDRLVARMHTRGTMLGPITIGGVEIPPTGLAFEQDWPPSSPSTATASARSTNSMIITGRSCSWGSRSEHPANDRTPALRAGGGGLVRRRAVGGVSAAAGLDRQAEVQELGVGR